MRQAMTQVYFHCSDDERVLMDQSPTEVVDITEAREHAARIVYTLITAPSLEDWRNWALHVCDELGEEIFVVPFAAALGKPN
jgi:hypothetical protein